MPTHAPFTYITPCFSLRGPILIMQSKTPTLQNQPQHAMAQTNFLTIHSIRWPIPTLKPVSALDGPKQVSNQSQHSMAHQHLLIYLQNVPAPASAYENQFGNPITENILLFPNINQVLRLNTPKSKLIPTSLLQL